MRNYETNTTKVLVGSRNEFERDLTIEQKRIDMPYCRLTICVNKQDTV